MLPQSASSISSSSLLSSASSSAAATSATTATTTTTKRREPVSYAFKYLNSPYAKRQYPRRLKLFFDHLELAGELEEQGQAFLDKAKDNPHWAQESIIDFIDFHKKRVLKKELAAGTLMNFFQPIKLFCEMNDLTTLNWKRLSKALPKTKSHSSNDRAPTIEEVRKLVEYPDRRLEPLVYVMCSSGIRLGAWDYLRWKHITAIEQQQQQQDDKKTVVAAKMIVYAGEPEDYYTFITPEAYYALKEYLDVRALHGEKITGESLLIRDEWRDSDTKMGPGGKYGLATCPKKIGSEAIKRIVSRALYAQGLRYRLAQGVRRHKWKGVHGFRKLFKTRAEQVMKPLNVELLLSHESGISDYYYRPTEREVLEDYLKGVPALTINEDIPNLKKQQEILEQKEHKQAEEIEKLKEKHSESTQIIIQYFTDQLEAVNKKFETKIAEMMKVQERVNKILPQEEEEEEQQQQKT
jgi:hypothetical protein